METNKRQHFISLFILSLLLSCSGEKKDSAQTETVSNKAIVRIETVSAQDVEQISEFTATVEANISNNIAPQNPVMIYSPPHRRKKHRPENLSPSQT